MNKRGVLGENIVMIYRLLLIVFIAFVVFSISSLVYTHEIVVRDSETVILARNIVDCLIVDGYVTVDNVEDGMKTNLLNYCGYEKDYDNVYAKVSFFKKNEVKSFLVLEDGDSGQVWIRELFDKVGPESAKNIVERIPGYFANVYEVKSLNDFYNMKVEVYVNALE